VQQSLIDYDAWILLGEFAIILLARFVNSQRWTFNNKKKKHHSPRRNAMKKMLLVVLMLLVAGVAYAATPKKPVRCNVNGKMQRVETVDACKALGGTVVEKKKVA